MTMINNEEYPYSSPRIEQDLSITIGQLEANLKIFADLIAQRERAEGLPEIYYDLQKTRLMLAISQLKDSRNIIGSLDWI